MTALTRSDVPRSWLSGLATWLVVATAAVPVLALEARAEAQVAAPTPLSDDTETTRGMAMGLGARASAGSSAAISYNPANLALARIYHIETTVGYHPQATRFSLAGAVVDSFSSSIAMGMQYRYVLGNGRDGHAGMEGRVALALPLGDSFSIGASGRYVSFTREGQSSDDNRSPFAEGITFDAAVRVTPIEGLHIAALGQNLIDLGSPLVPRLVGGSASYTIGNTFTLAFDGFADLSTFHHDDGTLRPEMLLGGGAELFTGQVPIRAGYIYDSGRQLHTITAGLGYTDPSFSIELAWRQQVVGGDGTTLLLSFRYFIH